MAWTDEMVEDLRKMWKEGLTTGEIGRRLQVSKNSIVGKVHRLGLSGRPSPIKKKEENSTEEAAKPAKVATPKATPVKEKEAEKIEIKAEAKESKTSETPKFSPRERSHKVNHNVSLADLDNHTCRWPVGDPKDENFHFCGKKVKIGQTYCEEHATIAYVKPNKK